MKGWSAGKPRAFSGGDRNMVTKRRVPSLRCAAPGPGPSTVRITCLGDGQAAHVNLRQVGSA
jgi:hypothetical protein